MSERPPFDAIRAAFWLVASVIAVHSLVVLAGVGLCVYYGASIIAGHFKCDADDRLTGLLAEALAAALAFGGGFLRGGSPPPPSPPPEKPPEKKP